MARSSRSLLSLPPSPTPSLSPSLSPLSLSSLSLSLSPSTSPLFIPSPLNPPCPARLDADLGSDFAHVLGQGRQAREESTGKTRIATQTPSGGSERRKEEEEEGERKPVCSSSFDSAARRGLKSERFFFFFFLRRETFSASLARWGSRVERNCRRLQRERGREEDRQGGGEEEGEGKVKSLRAEPSAFPTKNWGLGSSSQDPGLRCPFRRSGGGPGAGEDPARSSRRRR